jgi:hypothetical protein
MVSVYQFAIRNTMNSIRSEENQRLVARGENPMTAFSAAQVLAIAFMKDVGEVLADLVSGDDMTIKITRTAFAALETALIVECERAMKQRDEFHRTGISTASHGGSHDTIFGHILRQHGIYSEKKQ